MDESGNRCILDMVNHINLWTEDDSLIDSLLLEPRIHQSSEDDNRPCDSSRMAESEASTSGNLEAVRASAQKSGQASNVEGSSAGKRLGIKTPTVSKGSMSPRNGLNSKSTSSAAPVKKASLGSKNVGMSMRSAGGIEAPVLKARASSSSRNMVSNPTASTTKVLKTASSLGNSSTTSRTLKSPLDSSKGKESLRSSTSLSHSTVKTPATVASRSIHSADKKSVRSPVHTQKSVPSQSVGGLLNSPPGRIASGQSKLSRLKTAGPSTSISSNKPVKLTPARTRSGTFATPSPRKEASVGRSLLRATSKQTLGQGSSNSSSSSLMKKKTGIISFPNKQVRTKCAGTPPLKVSKITPIDVGNETGDVFLVTAEEDDMSRFSDAKRPPHNSITKRKSSLPVGSHVVAARVPLSSRNSLCNSSDSIHASKVQKLVILSLPKNS